MKAILLKPIEGLQVGHTYEVTIYGYDDGLHLHVESHPELDDLYEKSYSDDERKLFEYWYICQEVPSILIEKACIAIEARRCQTKPISHVEMVATVLRALEPGVAA